MYSSSQRSNGSQNTLIEIDIVEHMHHVRSAAEGKGNKSVKTSIIPSERPNTSRI
jgi:hypothetical protein